MKILAVRDDGAELVGDPDLSCALLRSENAAAVMPVASALARGNWEDGDGSDAELPQRVEDLIRQRSAEFTS